MAWRRLGDKPLSESMIVRLPTHPAFFFTENPAFAIIFSQLFVGQLDHWK